MAKALAAKITLSPPASILIWVSSLDPALQGEVDAGVYSRKGLLGYDVAMVIGPTPNHGIQLLDQIDRCRRWVGLDDLSHLGQQGVDICLRWFDDQLTVVFA